MSTKKERQAAKRRDELLKIEVRGFESGYERALDHAVAAVRQVNEAANVPGGNNTAERRWALDCAEIQIRNLSHKADRPFGGYPSVGSALKEVYASGAGAMHCGVCHAPYATEDDLKRAYDRRLPDEPQLWEVAICWVRTPDGPHAVRA